MIRVDGECSTNEMVVCMGNGEVDDDWVDENDCEWEKFV